MTILRIHMIRKAYVSPTQIKLEEATYGECPMGLKTVIFYLTTPSRPHPESTVILRDSPKNAMPWFPTKIHRHEQAAKAFVTRETV